MMDGYDAGWMDPGWYGPRWAAPLLAPGGAASPSVPVQPTTAAGWAALLGLGLPPCSTGATNCKVLDLAGMAGALTCTDTDHTVCVQGAGAPVGTAPVMTAPAGGTAPPASPATVAAASAGPAPMVLTLITELNFSTRQIAVFVGGTLVSQVPQSFGTVVTVGIPPTTVAAGAVTFSVGGVPYGLQTPSGQTCLLYTPGLTMTLQIRSTYPQDTSCATAAATAPVAAAPAPPPPAPVGLPGPVTTPIVVQTLPPCDPCGLNAGNCTPTQGAAPPPGCTYRVVSGVCQLTCAGMTPAGPVQVPPVASCVQGDINGDGQVTAIDALCLQRFLAGQPATATCPEPLPCNADVNGDGVVDAQDAQCILSLVAGLPCPSGGWSGAVTVHCTGGLTFDATSQRCLSAAAVPSGLPAPVTTPIVTQPVVPPPVPPVYAPGPLGPYTVQPGIGHTLPVHVPFPSTAPVFRPTTVPGAPAATASPAAVPAAGGVSNLALSSTVPYLPHAAVLRPPWRYLVCGVGDVPDSFGRCMGA